MNVEPRTLARTEDRSTSHEAAARQTRPNRELLYERILAALGRLGPLTDEEILDALRYDIYNTATPSGVRSRRNELVLSGRVTEHRDPSGLVIKRRGASGSPCTVWRAVEPGETIAPPKPTRRAKGAMLGDTTTPEHSAGMAAARRYAAWHIGDPHYANLIIDAYLEPVEAHGRLDDEGAPEEVS